MSKVYHTSFKIASPSTKKFNLSGNNTRENKEWIAYPRKGYHNSFVVMMVTINELIAWILAGYSFCDELQGDNVRRNQDNFASMRIVCIDDDNPKKQPDRFDFWRSDSFIVNNAAFMHYTASSTPEHEKVRIVFVLDCEVTDVELAKEILNALHYKYPETDKGHPTQVWSGAKDTLMYGFGNGLYFDVVEKSLLQPYREYKAQQTILNYKVAKGQKSDTVDTDFDDHVNRKLAEAFYTVAQAPELQRHIAIRRAGLICGSLQASKWTNKDLLNKNDLENRLDRAASLYDLEHYDKAIRTFRDGVSKGLTSPRPIPPDSERSKPKPQIKNFSSIQLITYSGTKQTLYELITQRKQFLTVREMIIATGLSRKTIENNLKMIEKDGKVIKRLKDTRFRKSPTNPYVYAYTIT
jgi:hypothetical protein